MSTFNKKYPSFTIKVNNEELTCHRINNDINGNPRYVTHFLSLNIELKDYGKIKGLKKYHTKLFGGGYVFSSYNLESSLAYYMNLVDVFYNRDTNKY